MDRWNDMPDRSEAPLYTFLDLCDEARVKSTFFFIGWYAQRFPKRVEEVVRRGHEAGCPSLNQIDVATLSTAQVRDSTRIAKGAIEDASGAPVISYCAPSFSFPPERCAELLRERSAMGFTIDSSINTAGRIHGGGFDKREFPTPEACAAIVELVQSFKPDIAHLHIFYGQLSSSAIAAPCRLQVPCVMTVHEYRLLCPVSTLCTQRQGVCKRCAAGNKRHAIALRCNRDSLFASTLSAGESWVRDRYFNYLDHIAHFFRVSEFCLAKHTEYLPRIRQQSSVLYTFIGDPDVAATPASVTVDAPFLYAGRLAQEKGVTLLCSAFRDRPNLRLRIAGDGPLARSLRTHFADCANIEFLGKLPPAALKQEMRHAEFSIMPSERYENNPMSVLESFSVGTPVLSANIGGIPELVLPGSTGFLFAPSDKVSLLCALHEAHAMPAESRHSMGIAVL